MTNNQTKPTPQFVLLVYGKPTSTELPQASWFRAEDRMTVISAAQSLKFSVIDVQTDADRAVLEGAHEGVLKGTGRIIVGTLTPEVYRRIEEHAAKETGALAVKPSKDTAASSKQATEQNTNSAEKSKAASTPSDPWAAARAFAAEVSLSFDRITTAAEACGRPSAGRFLRLSAPTTLALRWLIPRLEEFHAGRPDVEVTVTTTTTLREELRGGFDVAIRRGSTDRGAWPQHRPTAFLSERDNRASDGCRGGTAPYAFSQDSSPDDGLRRTCSLRREQNVLLDELHRLVGRERRGVSVARAALFKWRFPPARAFWVGSPDLVGCSETSTCYDVPTVFFRHVPLCG
jgi:hypothetical protein